MKIIIVGAGLFGSMAAALCRKQGLGVTVIDAYFDLAASKCSSGLMRRSWLAGLGEDKISKGMAVLQQLYAIEEKQFLLEPAKKNVSLLWVNPKLVLRPPDIREEVTTVREGTVTLRTGKTFTGKVLVAAGAFCNSLVMLPHTKKLIGSALLLPGKTPALMQVYAPYRQAIAFNISQSEIWAGDGTAIIEKNWNAEQRIALLKDRSRKFFDLDVRKSKIRIGARPYVQGHKQGYFAKVEKNTWVSTGGAKNGTLLAAYQAQLFLEAIQ